jgi:hypothetical protein
MGTGRAKARAPNRNTGTHGGGTRDARTPRRPRARRGSTSRRVADREDEQGGAEKQREGEDSTEIQRDRREPADPGDPAAARHAQMLLLVRPGRGESGGECRAQAGAGVRRQ